MYKIKTLFLAILMLNIWNLQSQSLGASPDQVKALTSLWQGERFADGRPKESDVVLEALERATLEQIWGFPVYALPA